MCSVQEVGETQLPRKKSQVGRKCMKCEEGAVAIARTKDPFCKSCFNAYFTHRFRATIGKSRLIRDGEKALLAFSGGINSRVMLALVEEGLSQRVHKKLRFIPTVIHIDEGAVLELDWTKRCRNTSEIISIGMEVGLPIYFTQLEQVFDRCEAHSIEKLHMSEPSGSESLIEKKESIRNPTPVLAEPKQRTQGEPQDLSQIAEDKASSTELTKQSSETQGDHVSSKHKLSTDEICSRLESFLEKRDVSAETKLKELFAAAQSSTAKENLLLSLRHKLLHEIAKQHGYTKVLVGDNATRLAVRLLGNIAQGRGASLPLDTGFADARDHDVIFARPLREFPSNEVAMHMALNNLKTVTIPSLTTLTTDKGSLEQLTESFIAGLQADFPSTVNTVFRTGDKLQVGSSSSGEAGLTEKHSCSLCQAPLDKVDDEAVFTHLKVPDDSSPTLWSNLCYGCRLTMKDVKSGVNLLPPFVHSDTTVPVDSIGDQQQHRSREAMRDQIQEYLLDDS